MVKTMKRSLSMLLALLMLLCVLPVSTFAADKKCTLTVGKNNAAVRSISHQEGEVVERYKKGKSVTYTHLRINDALNLWYGIPNGNGGYKYIYSGNVKKISTSKGTVTAQVEISRDLLNQDTCLAQAKKIAANGDTGYDETYMAKEIFAHACAYYVSKPALEMKGPSYLSEKMICTLFPNSNACDVNKAVNLLLKSVERFNNRASCVEIGEEGDIESVAFEAIYEVWWDFVKALGKSSTTIF